MVWSIRWVSGVFDELLLCVPLSQAFFFAVALYLFCHVSTATRENGNSGGTPNLEGAPMQTPGRINNELKCHTCSMVAKGIIRRMAELREANKEKVCSERFSLQSEVRFCVSKINIVFAFFRRRYASVPKKRSDTTAARSRPSWPIPLALPSSPRCSLPLCDDGRSCCSRWLSTLSSRNAE